MTPPYGEDPGGVPPPGGETDHGENPLETSQQDLVFPTSGGRNKGGQDGGTGELNFQEAEHGGPVNCDLAHYSPLYGGIETPGGTGEKTVVGSGGIESCGTGGKDRRCIRLSQRQDGHITQKG